MMIEVKSATELGIDKEEHRTAEKVLIGIFDAVNRGLYVKGYRNNIAVDMSIACKVLGLNAASVLGHLPLNSKEKDNLLSRLVIIDDYLDEWASSNIWNYMLDKDEWISWCENTQYHCIPLAKS